MNDKIFEYFTIQKEISSLPIPNNIRSLQKKDIVLNNIIWFVDNNTKSTKFNSTWAIIKYVDLKGFTFIDPFGAQCYRPLDFRQGLYVEGIDPELEKTINQVKELIPWANWLVKEKDSWFVLDCEKPYFLEGNWYSYQANYYKIPVKSNAKGINGISIYELKNY